MFSWLTGGKAVHNRSLPGDGTYYLTCKVSSRNACHNKLLCKKCLRSRPLPAEQKYKLFKNKLTTILRFAEKSYYSSLLVANRGDAKTRGMF